MSKRAFRSTPGDARPSYPTLRRFLRRRGAAVAGLALGLLASGCDPFVHDMAGTPVYEPALIDARSDGLEAGSRTDAGPQRDSGPPTDTGPSTDVQAPASARR